MLLIIILTFIAVLVIIKTAKIEFITRVVLYCFVGYWFVSLIISCINPYDFYPIKAVTYVLLLLGVVSFVVGMLVRKNRIMPNNGHLLGCDIPLVERVIDKMVTNKIVISVFLIVSIYCIPMVINTVVLAAISGGVAMTDDKMEVVFLNSAFNSLLFQYVMYPLLHLDYALIAFSIVKRKFNILSWIAFLVYLIEFMLMAGGRSILFVALIYIIIIYICTNTKETIKQLNIKRLLAFSILLAIVFYGVSVMNSYRTEGILIGGERDSDKSPFEEVTERIVTYSTLPFALFNDALEKGTYDRFQYTYGRATFAGVDVLVNGLMKRIGIPYKTTMDIVIDVQENYIQVGPDSYYNYAYTGLLYHYIDFGVFGIFFFPFIFGFAFRKIIIYFYKKPRASGLLLIGVSFFLALHSIFTCYFIKPWVLPYIIILLFLYHIKGNNRRGRLGLNANV